MTLPAPVALGPFVVTERVGRGGMGDVWRGEHVEQRVPVAIKVLGDDYTGSPEFLEAFQAEIQAVARLRHRGIVMVFDHGLIPATVSEATRGYLRPGHPYLVMELASGGTLQSAGPPRDWVSLRQTLLDVLDALAHAHARGVIHRDVKPANVLICSDEDARPGLKLSDFGLAAAGDRRRAERLVGTPAFMAPEQCDGRWRDHGPWTDLYAFGCLAYALSSGKLPFNDTNPMQIVLQQFADEAPPLEPLLDLPEGFEAWVRRLLAKAPGDRFRWAADASHALRRLSHRRNFQLGAPAAWRGGEERLTASGATLLGGRHTTRSRSLGERRDTAVSSFAHATRGATQVDARPLGPPRRPPVPATWRRQPTLGGQVTSLTLAGVGLGLYGLRTVPHIGREAERDMLWQRLLDVHQQHRASVCVLLGQPGVGKTRLAVSVAQRAHELGAAQLLHGKHSTTLDGPAQGVPRMLSSFLRCIGLERRELRARLQQLLGDVDSLDVDAVTELLAPATARDIEAGARAIQFSSPEERYATLRRLLDHLAGERPLVICLDDVQWGLDTLGFVEHVLAAQAQHPSPILFVLTARNDVLAEQALERARLDHLLAHASVTRIDLEPLPPDAHARLVSALLGLDGQLADDVARRTAGNPLFAVQLVGDWVERGVLEPGRQGFRLRPGERAVIPDDIHGLWASRLDKLLDGQGAHARRALELAAALGVDVSTNEWHSLCELAGLGVHDELASALFAAGLATRRSDGWSFSHNMFRESIERSAREARRWARHNKRCADMIEQLYTAEQRGRAERIGRYLLQTASLNRAIDLLLEGARERFEVSEYDMCLALLDRRELTLEGLHVPQRDPRWARGWILRAKTLRVQGELEAAALLASRAERMLADIAEHDADYAHALLCVAAVAIEQHRLDDATRNLRDAIGRFGALGDRKGRADAAWGLGVISLNQGNIDEGRALLESARVLAEMVDDAMLLAKANHQLARIAMLGGALDEAEAYVRASWAAFEQLGTRSGIAECLNGLGELHRARGDFGAAEASYREAIALHQACGSEGLTCQANLGLVLLERQEFDEARVVLESARRDFVRREVDAMVGILDVALLPCLAREADWAGFARHLDEAPSRLGPLVDPDVARPAQQAGELAMTAGCFDLAIRALELARAQWSGLARSREAERVAGLLESLRPID